MLLKIKNTGKISFAQIEISGITVIAGVNNTGKSTVGKVLFCLFNSFYKIEQQIARERVKQIADIIENDLYNIGIGFFDHELNDFASSVCGRKAHYLGKKECLAEDVRSFYFHAEAQYDTQFNGTHFSDISERIMEVLTITDEEISVAVFKKRLQAEFDVQINNIYKTKLDSEIALKVNGREIKIYVQGNEHIEIKDSFSLNSEVIYIDDPLAFDNLATSPTQFDWSHRGHLLTKLFVKSGTSPVKDAINEIIAAKKLEAVFAMLNNVCKGDVISKNSSHRFTIAYLNDDSKTALSIQNVSTGIKSFAILKTLLQNGSLHENGILVLDEPEIHLHPEWQLVFAELVVLLQKEFNIRILLNTHSPYFLDAIDVYSHKYDIADRCKYYLAEDDDDTTAAVVTDVSSDIERIYDKLSRPLQELENERYSDD